MEQVVLLGDNVSINTYGSDFYAEGIGFASSATSSINVGTGGIDLDEISGAVTLGNLTASGSSSDLSITNATSISQQSNTVIAIGRNSLLGSASTTSVILDKSSGATNNSFGGYIDLNTDTATIIASGQISLRSGSTINGDLSLQSTTPGALITSTGDIFVDNAADDAVATFNTSGNVIFIDDNNFNRVNLLNAGTVSIKDTVDNIELSANSAANTGGITGSLTVVATGGNITDYGQVLVDAATSLTVDSGASVILDDVTNTLAGLITLDNSGSFSNVTLANTAAINLNAISVTNNLPGGHSARLR